MSYKKKIYWTLLGSVAGFIIAFILTSPSLLNLCSSGDKFCFEPYDEIIGQPLGILSICLFVISIILLITREQVFYAWSKFSIIFFPMAFVIIFMAPVINGTLIGFDKELATLYLASIFVIISLLIIIFKSFQFRKEEK